MKTLPESKWREAKGFGVFVTCPGCADEFLLDHVVDSKGVVSPSLDCPMCSYHEWVILEGWEGDDS